MNLRIPRLCPFLQDPEIEEYICGIARRIAASRDDYLSIRPIRILDCPQEVNAYTLLKKGLYVCSGLLMCTDNEAEMAGVLGHELAHRKQRHYASIYRPFTYVSRSANWRAHSVRSIIEGVYIGISRKLLWREELEADRLAVGYLNGAGYHPKGLEMFLRKAQQIQQDQPGRVASWLSTHPPIEERLVHIHRHLRDLPEKANYTGVEIYHRRTEKLRRSAGKGSPT